MQFFLSESDRQAAVTATVPRVIDAVVGNVEEPLSIDELIAAAVRECERLPEGFSAPIEQIGELHSRLALGRLHLAVVGEFNRGKSTFINGLVGMKLLPTSVLPITAVPTHIFFGNELTCTIRFLNRKPDLVVCASREKIADTLLTYVTEEHNPKNRFCVRSVDVTVPSPLLKNGTVLIDTPGFGSTYLHNTQTALNALSNCDAALFLLSADPPMTQTEVEFLKQLIQHVPRLFFILNKVDLLTAEQLKKVERFIGDTLAATLKTPQKPHIFHLCARRAEYARTQTDDDHHWVSSGMEAIKNDIIAFMLREKYFTLSQALNDKLKEAVLDIITELKKRAADVDDPLIRLQRERAHCVRERDAVCKEVEKERALVAAEKKAIVAFLDEQLAADKQPLLRRIHEAFSILLDASPCTAASLGSVSIALKKIVPDAFAAYGTRVVARINRPLKKALVLHGNQARLLEERMRGTVSRTALPAKDSFAEAIEQLEIDNEESGAEAVTGIDFPLTPQWNDCFYSREKRLQRLHQRNDHRLDELLQNSYFTFSRRIRQKIDVAFNALGEQLDSGYRLLVESIGREIEQKEKAIEYAIETNGRSATRLSTLLDAFNAIHARLH